MPPCVRTSVLYEVEVNGARYRRNRRQLRSTAELSAVGDNESVNHDEPVGESETRLIVAHRHNTCQHHDVPIEMVQGHPRDQLCPYRCHVDLREIK